MYALTRLGAQLPQPQLSSLFILVIFDLSSSLYNLIFSILART